MIDTSGERNIEGTREEAAQCGHGGGVCVNSVVADVCVSMVPKI